MASVTSRQIPHKLNIWHIRIGIAKGGHTWSLAGHLETIEGHEAAADTELVRLVLSNLLKQSKFTFHQQFLKRSSRSCPQQHTGRGNCHHRTRSSSQQDNKLEQRWSPTHSGACNRGYFSRMFPQTVPLRQDEHL